MFSPFTLEFSSGILGLATAVILKIFMESIVNFIMLNAVYVDVVNNLKGYYTNIFELEGKGALSD